jgi:hypothetical protein
MYRTATILLVFACVFMLPTNAHADFDVYQTVDDFVKDTPKAYAGYEFASQTGTANDIVIKLKNKATGGKAEFACADVWGFKYKDKLFRVVRKDKYWQGANENFYVMLSVGSTPFVWVRGYMLLAEVEKDAKYYQEDEVYRGFLTATLIGDMLLLPGSESMGKEGKWIQEASVQFFVDHPELIWVDQCYRKERPSGFKHYIYGPAQKCVLIDQINKERSGKP